MNPFKFVNLNTVTNTTHGRIWFSTEDMWETVVLFEEEDQFHCALKTYSELEIKPFCSMYVVLPTFKTTFEGLQGLVYPWPDNRHYLNTYLCLEENISFAMTLSIVLELTEIVHFLENVCNIRLAEFNLKHFVVDELNATIKCRILDLSGTTNKSDSYYTKFGQMLLAVIVRCEVEQNKDVSDKIEFLNTLLRTELLDSINLVSLSDFRQKLMLINGT
jgi:hypothetical protein